MGRERKKWNKIEEKRKSKTKMYFMRYMRVIIPFNIFIFSLWLWAVCGHQLRSLLIRWRNFLFIQILFVPIAPYDTYDGDGNADGRRRFDKWCFRTRTIHQRSLRWFQCTLSAIRLNAGHQTGCINNRIEYVFSSFDRISLDARAEVYRKRATRSMACPTEMHSSEQGIHVNIAPNKR